MNEFIPGICMCHLTLKSLFIKLHSHIWINSLALITKYKGPDGTFLAKLELIWKVETMLLLLQHHGDVLKDVWRMTWIIIVVRCILYEVTRAQWPSANAERRFAWCCPARTLWCIASLILLWRMASLIHTCYRAPFYITSCIITSALYCDHYK